MNSKQKIVLFIAAIALIQALVYVPWVTLSPLESPQGHLVQTNYEYRLLNNPPEDPWGMKEPTIAWLYPLQKAGLILVVNGLLLFLFRNRKQKHKTVLSQPASPQAAF